MHVVATHDQGGVSALLILGVILLVIIAALVAIGVAQRDDPDREVRRQFRDALYGAPRRQSATAVTSAREESETSTSEDGDTAFEPEQAARHQDEGKAAP
ncbi:hypothetical protein ACSHWB_45035 [Lentzea sp. HUAS TT2]|uniref:hypothetical protein n=1 Tax=Lentzea sp. HUAS TT2 TaxID=3447454 RepID=UPI003F6E6F2C